MKSDSLSRLSVCCEESNDLYRTLVREGLEVSRWATAEQAIAGAVAGSGVMILADGYPDRTTELSPALYEEAARKGLRLYVEFPDALPGIGALEKRSSHHERCVVTSEAFGEALTPMRILCIHDCHFVRLPPVADAHLVLAKVAGYDTAVYGLDDTEQFPILFQFSGQPILVATTKLSQFITGRYGPASAFQAIWQFVLGFLQPESPAPRLAWQPSVRPSYGAKENLSSDAQRKSILRGIDWHDRARVLVHPSWSRDYLKLREGRQNTEFGTFAPLPTADLPVGDGREGLLEGIGSIVDWRGNQKACWWLRSDCNGESSLAFALRARLDGDARSRAIAGNLLDRLYSKPGEVIRDPAKPSHGLFRWAPDNDVDFYQENDVKAMLGCIGSAALLGTDRWDASLLLNILANFRTTGVNGYRGQKLTLSQLEAHGWRHFWDAETIHLSPHFEAWCWAVYLWLYHKTKWPPLLERVKRGFRLMMEAYPDRWFWTNGMQQERGRMLLALAWLVRVEDTAEHRAWLRRIFDDMSRSQDECGAIAEELGPPGKGRCQAPITNMAYGQHEAPLIQQNGDPSADMLYTCNFAFLGLHEAFAATGETDYREAEDRLAQFLIRIQAQSESHPELDGAWFRAFDFRKWEYWGSNADHGWGAWCVECGWTQGWIATVLALRELNLNLWDLSRESGISRNFESARNEMFPDL